MSEPGWSRCPVVRHIGGSHRQRVARTSAVEVRGSFQGEFHRIRIIFVLWGQRVGGGGAMSEEPRKGRQNLAHGVSRGLDAASLSPQPSPPLGERVAEGRVRSFSPGLTPWAKFFWPTGPGMRLSHRAASQSL